MSVQRMQLGGDTRAFLLRTSLKDVRLETQRCDPGESRLPSLQPAVAQSAEAHFIGDALEMELLCGASVCLCV